MGSATSLSVQYDSQFVRAGETLSGKVLLRVLAADKVHANEVQVRFHGREHAEIKVQHGSGKTHRTVRHTANHDVIDVTLTLARFDAQLILQKGDFVFPFQIALPAGLPSGFAFHVPDGSCSLRYTCEAVLTSPGALWGTSEHKSQLAEIQLAGAHVDLPPQPQMLNPRSDRINFCCCFDKGTLNSGSALDKTTVSNGEQLQTRIAFENHSTCRMKAVEFFLWEDVTCHAAGHSRSKRIARFRTRILPEQLGTAFAPLAVKPEALNDQEVLQRLWGALSGAGSAGSVLVSIDQCANDYNGVTVSVRHVLEIKIDTPFGYNNPNHEARVYVQSGKSGGGGVGYEIPFAPGVAIPADWNPRTVRSLPMAQASVVMAPVVAATRVSICGPGPDQHLVQSLLDALDKGYPMSAAGNVAEFFATPPNDEIATLSPAALASIFEHVTDCGQRLRVGTTLARRFSSAITCAHLCAVARSMTPEDAVDASTTGARWQVLSALSKVCSDPHNSASLADALNATGRGAFYSPALVATLFSSGDSAMPSAPPAHI